MPLVKKNSRKQVNDGGPPAKRSRQQQHHKGKKTYKYLDYIGYKHDHHHALYRTLPDSIEEAIAHVGRNIVSLLNADGGIIAYGVRPTGMIYGEQISRREQDILNHTTIDETVKRIIPVVEVGMYRVSYTDVLDVPESYHSSNKAPKRYQVLEIRVEPGRPYQLYEDQNHEVYQRRKSDLYGPLTPHEIKDITVKQFKQQISDNGRLAQILSGSSKPKPPSSAKVVVDLTTDEKSEKSKRAALSVVNGEAGKNDKENQGKSSSSSSGSKPGGSSVVGGKAGNPAVDKVTVVGALKPGEGHKTLVHRAMGSSNRVGRILQAPVVRVVKISDQVSSGESDQETPIPPLSTAKTSSFIKPPTSTSKHTTASATTSAAAVSIKRPTTTTAISASSSIKQPAKRPATASTSAASAKHPAITTTSAAMSKCKRPATTTTTASTSATVLNPPDTATTSATISKLPATTSAAIIPASTSVSHHCESKVNATKPTVQTTTSLPKLVTSVPARQTDVQPSAPGGPPTTTASKQALPKAPPPVARVAPHSVTASASSKKMEKVDPLKLDSSVKPASKPITRAHYPSASHSHNLTKKIKRPATAALPPPPPPPAYTRSLHGGYGYRTTSRPHPYQQCQNPYATNQTASASQSYLQYPSSNAQAQGWYAQYGGMQQQLLQQAIVPQQPLQYGGQPTPLMALPCGAQPSSAIVYNYNHQQPHHY